MALLGMDNSTQLRVVELPYLLLQGKILSIVLDMSWAGSVSHYLGQLIQRHGKGSPGKKPTEKPLLNNNGVWS
jgi:hypothetical protein